jgi:ligand-binding SRPBCC domain-containing protein
VSPLFGIKLKWVTEITVVENNKHFIDNQLFGPYSLWHHKHFFEENDKGVLMTDLVHYALPLGILGRLMNFLVVKKQLKTIFDYRTQKINELFPQK